MSEAIWRAVDDYAVRLLSGSDPALDAALDAALAASEAAGLPAIAVSATQGKLLSLLARAMGAARILEIGTLGGYSTIWLARALGPGGRLVTLELSPKHAAVAAENLARAGVADRAEIRIGPAADSLRQMIDGGELPFDFVFIDADKPAYPGYFAQVMRLVRPGTLIVADNVVRKGDVANPSTTDPMVQGVQRYHEAVAAERRVSATILQTVGSKGYDGFSFALVTGA